MRSIALLLAAGLSAAALPGPLPGQPIVSPRGMANSYTGLHDAVPWGGSPSPEQFYQQVHDDLRKRPLLIQGMAFRHAWNASYPTRSYTAILTLGEAAVGATAIGSSFAQNWRQGGSKTTVLNGTISFPAFKAYTASPAPFDAPISFSTPYAHGGDHSLIWQVYISQCTASTSKHSFEAGPSTTHTGGVLGKGCLVKGQTAPLTSSGGISATALAERLTNGPTNGLALLAIGNHADKWLDQQLPVSLVFAGSPSCFLHINVLTYVPPTTAWLFVRPYKWRFGLGGVRIRTQWAILDNGLIRTSNGLDHSFPYTNGTTSRWPVARVWAHSFGSNLPPTGTVEAKGLVVQFRE